MLYMDMKLDEDMFTNKVQYFFSLHGPRFEYMNEVMAEALSERFGVEFRAIRVFNAWPSKDYRKGNYLVLNRRGYKLKKELGKPVVFLPDYEDVNVEFSQDSRILQMANKLRKKQDTIFVYPFTTAFLELSDKDFTVLGPNELLARNLDNKVNQLKLFKKLELPHNNARIYDTEQDLLASEYDIVPSYISAAYTSGGNESGLIYTPEMLHRFLAKLRNINKQNSFVVSDIFEDIVLAPNVNALITADGLVRILVLSDQILHGNRYLGNTYPSLASEIHQKKIEAITQKIGKHLYEQGYKGLFGLDFLINKAGNMVVVDLNPRHQGGYVCNQLMLERMGISMVRLELATYFDEDITISQKSLECGVGFSWAHSKITPNEKGQEIKSAFCESSIEDAFSDIGSSFVAGFYEPRSVFVEGYVGYQVHTSKDKDKLDSKLLATKKKFDAKVLGP